MGNDFKYVIRYSNVLNIQMFGAGKIYFKNIFCIKALTLTKAFVCLFVFFKMTGKTVIL